ncbi:MAG: RHS repeat-associated core domain-containing protein [Pseudomonadota bacterium]
MQSIDSPVGRFGYEYGSPAPQGSTLPKADLLANLIKVSLPTHYDAATKGYAYANRGLTSSSISRLYHYEDPRHPTLLTGITVSGIGSDGQLINQRIRTWAYDRDGRGILSVKGTPRRLDKHGQTIPGTGIEQVNLRYPAPGQTLLTNSLGQTTTYTHTLIGEQARLLKVSGAGCTTCNAANVQYTYDPLGRMISATQLTPTGEPIQTTRTDRDAQGRPVQISTLDYHHGHAQPARLQVRYAYAPLDTRNPQDPDPVTDQPILIARPSVLPGQEHQIHLTYNPAGQPIRVTETGWTPGQGGAPPTTLTRTTTYRYTRLNGRSLLTRIDGPLQNGQTNSPVDSDITRYTWDKRGDYPIEITQPGNLMSRVETRDEAGRPTAVHEINGQLTRLHYAYTGQTARIERAGRQVSIAYDARMQPTALTSNDGQTIRIAYLPTQGKLRYTLPDGQTREESYNTEMQITAIGWLDAQGHALGKAGRYAYDAHTGQLAGITLPSGLHTTFSYDTSGQLSHWQQGKASGSQHFDPQTQLLEADVAGATYRASADAQAATLALTLPTGAVHTELIDDFGRVVQQTSPERGTRTAIYDAADHTLELRDAVRVMSARYDAAGRLVERRHQTLADQQTRSVRYTWQGPRLVRIDDSAQLTEYTYDSQARRTSERVTLKATANTPAQTHITQYRYDVLGRLYQTVLPEGATLTYRFDAISRVSRVDYQGPAYSWWVKAIRWVWADYGTQPLIADIRTDSAHGVLGYTHANGERVSTDFDQAMRLTRQQDGTATTQLTYNAADEIAQLKRNTQTLNLNYDLRGRLQQVTQGTQRQDYTLDTNGNRLGKTDNTAQAQPYAYRPASDQLLRSATHSYRYNAVGEPIQITRSLVHNNSATRTLAYGTLGELVSVTDNGQQTAHYRYNQNRQRIAKTANGHTTFFLWQGGTIAAEADAQGHIDKRYIYLGSRPVALIQYDADGNARLYAVHTDHLGTPLQITDADQRIVWQAEYDVYGRATIQNHSLHSGASPPAGGFIGTAHASAPTRFDFNLRLPGQYEDTETGYYYNFHRYYNPETGRYLTPDPIGLSGGTNLYAYVDGNPAGAGDPWGLDSTSANGITTFNTAFADLPMFTIPTLQGWQDYTNNSLFGHTYNQKVSVNGLNSSELQNLWSYIVDHPTPNSGAFPATFAGTYNPATPNYGAFSGFLADKLAPDDVMTFLRTGLSGRTYVVNVTTQHHSLAFGIVIRGVHCEKGKAIFDNYGEGGGLFQALPFGASDYLINDIWYWATEDALEKVTGRKYSVNGKDWNKNN